MRALTITPTARPRPLQERCPTQQPGRARHVAVDLTPQAIERIAAQVARLLRDRNPEKQPQLLSAGELARRLRVERPWVYRHRALLGGLRIGAGPKAPWRFDYERALEALRDLQAGQATTSELPPPRRSR